jgi:hypothetical protein
LRFEHIRRAAQAQERRVGRTLGGVALPPTDARIVRESQLSDSA